MFAPPERARMLTPRRFFARNASNRGFRADSEALFRHMRCDDVGVPDPVWQETPLAVFVLKEGCELSNQEVLDLLESKLAHFKHPRYMVVRDEPMPRGMSGKLLKREMKAEYAANLDLAIRLR